MSNDSEARLERAARLREQIARLTGKDNPGARHAESVATATGPTRRRRPPRVGPASPRAFIEERMKELDGDNDEPC